MPLVITGASGFVGRHLVAALVSRRADPVVALTRRLPTIQAAGAQWVEVDVYDTSRYEPLLHQAPVVYHLAATTGKARPRDYQRNNVEATEQLVAACRRAGVRRFVLVSSVAAGFADRRHYPYAESKIAAERIVKDSGLRHTILRPTAIFGPGSPVEAGLRRLATLPIVPVFGSGRTLVQPLSVDELVDVLCALPDAGDDADGIIDVGGPETLTVTDLLTRLRATAGGGSARFVHVPLGLTRTALALIERPLLPLLPLSAGQLATFANDGTARFHPFVAEILTHQSSDSVERPATDDVQEGAAAGRPLPIDERALTIECRRLAVYLTGAPPTEYQVSKYVEAHLHRDLVTTSEFDRFLLRFSSWRGGLSLADAYAGAFCRRALVRAKLVVILGVLESSPPAYRWLDTPTADRHMVIVDIIWLVLSSAVTLAAALALLGPVHLWKRLRGGTRRHSSG